MKGGRRERVRRGTERKGEREGEIKSEGVSVKRESRKKK